MIGKAVRTTTSAFRTFIAHEASGGYLLMASAALAPVVANSPLADVHFKALGFHLGLFENPYVDPARAEAIVGSAAFRAAALDAQRRSIVLLENHEALLPKTLKPGARVYLYNVAPAAAQAAGFVVVDRAADADVVIARIAAPYTNHANYFFGARHHEGSVDYPADNADLVALKAAAAAGRPVIVSVYLDRPAVLAAIPPLATALLADFGASDEALLEVMSGKVAPQGKLPFELPASERAVEAQASDLSHDSVAPLFGLAFGLTYEARP